jgi:hypothetical protein
MLLLLKPVIATASARIQSWRYFQKANECTLFVLIFLHCFRTNHDNAATLAAIENYVVRCEGQSRYFCSRISTDN